MTLGLAFLKRLLQLDDLRALDVTCGAFSALLTASPSLDRLRQFLLGDALEKGTMNWSKGIRKPEPFRRRAQYSLHPPGPGWIAASHRDPDQRLGQTQRGCLRVLGFVFWEKEHLQAAEVMKSLDDGRFQSHSSMSRAILQRHNTPAWDRAQARIVRVEQLSGQGRFQELDFPTYEHEYEYSQDVCDSVGIYR